MKNEIKSRIATGSQTVGPFFSFGLSTNAALGTLVGPSARGDRIRLRFRVLDGQGAPVSDALVEIWHADGEGQYAPHDRTFGRLSTDEAGECVFETIRPGVPQTSPADAAHVNVCLFMRGILRHMYTRCYFAGDPRLSGDPALAAVPDARRSTLLAQRSAGQSEWVFEIHLQGERETVFFDL